MGSLQLEKKSEEETGKRWGQRNSGERDLQGILCQGKSSLAFSWIEIKSHWRFLAETWSDLSYILKTILCFENGAGQMKRQKEQWGNYCISPGKRVWMNKGREIRVEVLVVVRSGINFSVMCTWYISPGSIPIMSCPRTTNSINNNTNY